MLRNVIGNELMGSTDEEHACKQYVVLVTREGEANSMAFAREQNKEETTSHPSPKRHSHQQLSGFLRRIRVEALHDVLIKQRHRRKHHDGHECVQEIDELEPITSCNVRRKPGGTVDHPQAPASGHPVPDLALVVPEAVGEGEEKAGGAASSEQEQCEGVVGVGGAVAFVCEDG